MEVDGSDDFPFQTFWWFLGSSGKKNQGCHGNPHFVSKLSDQICLGARPKFLHSSFRTKVLTLLNIDPCQAQPWKRQVLDSNIVG